MEEEEDEGECFLAFARVYSGCIKKGSTLYVLGPKYQPQENEENGYTDEDKDDQIKGEGDGVNNGLA